MGLFSKLFKKNEAIIINISINTNQQPNVEEEKSTSDLLKDVFLFNKTNIKTDGLNLHEELSSFKAEIEFELDENEKKQIKELKRITDNIDKKLITEIAEIPKENYKIDYINELNPLQLTAVTTLNYPLLVIAGAGSGKTRVITYKVAYLIEKGLNPSQILLLTFTKKASK